LSQDLKESIESDFRMAGPFQHPDVRSL